MAALAPPADQAADLLQNLSLDSQPKPLEIPEPMKKPTANQNGSVDSGNAPNGHIPPYERSLTPLLHDFTEPTMCYVPNGYPSPAYYYGGYEGTGNEWDDFSRYGSAEGVDVASGFYGDNGSLMYPGYGYAPFGPYSPATSPVPGNEQLYGTQQYHYPSPYFQSLPTSAPNGPSLSAPPQTEVSTSAPADQKPLPVETMNLNSNGPKGGSVKGNDRSGTLKSTQQNSGYSKNSSFGVAPLPGSINSGYQDVRFGYDGLASPIMWSDGPAFADGQRVTNTGMANSISNAKNAPYSRIQSYSPNSQFMGLHHPRPLSAMGAANGFINRLYPNKLYGQYGSTVSSGMKFGYDTRTNGRGWLGVDNKYKNRGQGGGFYGYANESMDGLNELNRGPRAKGFKNQKNFSSVTAAVKGQNIPVSGANEEEKSKASATPDREQYNTSDFPIEYTDAKFFVIKSYSEDDVHKSIKYSVWASTPNGNKKLDAAYREAREKAANCPVFLFFSVNTSGQFVGVAEMLGPVDFQKNVEYWQQDKWYGCFPVKWHIVKDVPNSLLKHIILENNENKPVTNSRDTQEVKLEQGLKMVKIFKDHSSKTCLLDDFEFYENRQKAIQEKKAKQHLQFQKQAWEGKLITEKKEVFNGDLKSQKSSEVSPDQIKETAAALSNGDPTLLEDPKDAKAVVPEAMANGVGNACCS